MQSHFSFLSQTPIIKGLLVGAASTLGAVAEQDWKILAVGAVVQLGMAWITFLASKGRTGPSRRTRDRKTAAITRRKHNSKV